MYVSQTSSVLIHNNDNYRLNNYYIPSSLLIFPMNSDNIGLLLPHLNAQILRHPAVDIRQTELQLCENQKIRCC